MSEVRGNWLYDRFVHGNKEVKNKIKKIFNSAKYSEITIQKLIIYKNDQQ